MLMRCQRSLGIARELRSGRSSAAALVDVLIADLTRVKATIGGVAAIDRERSTAEAEAADRRLREGSGRPLEGVPFTVKDWVDVAGWPVLGAAGGHPGTPGRRPDHDATAVARLTGAPAVAVPVGTRDGLPVAVQVVAAPWNDHVALAAARRIEESLSPAREGSPPAARTP